MQAATEQNFYRDLPSGSAPAGLLHFPMLRISKPVFALVLLLSSSICFAAGLFIERQWLARPKVLQPLVHRQAGGRVRGSFEHKDAVLLGFNELIQYHPETLVQMVSAIRDQVTIIGLVKNEQQRQQVLDLLHARGISTSGLYFFIWPVESMWVRDFGPFFLTGNETTVVGYDYSMTHRDMENLVAAALASRLGMKLDHCELSLEGGNLLSNGQGLCISSNSILAMNKPRGYDVKRMGDLLKERLQFTAWTYLLPLSEEPLKHVDMYLTLVSPTTAVVGSYTEAEDSLNAAILNKNAATLAATKTNDVPLQVVRIKQPPHRDGKWRTYTNVLFANNVLLVPQYPTVSPDLDREAIETYQRLLPDRKVVGIDCTSLIEKRGALHCISLGIPVLQNSSELE